MLLRALVLLRKSLRDFDSIVPIAARPWRTSRRVRRAAGALPCRRRRADRLDGRDRRRRMAAGPRARVDSGVRRRRRRHARRRHSAARHRRVTLRDGELELTAGRRGVWTHSPRPAVSEPGGDEPLSRAAHECVAALAAMLSARDAERAGVPRGESRARSCGIAPPRRGVTNARRVRGHATESTCAAGRRHGAGSSTAIRRSPVAILAAPDLPDELGGGQACRP